MHGPPHRRGSVPRGLKVGAISRDGGVAEWHIGLPGRLPHVRGVDATEASSTGPGRATGIVCGVDRGSRSGLRRYVGSPLCRPVYRHDQAQGVLADGIVAVGSGGLAPWCRGRRGTGPETPPKALRNPG